MFPELDIEFSFIEKCKLFNTMNYELNYNQFFLIFAFSTELIVKKLRSEMTHDSPKSLVSYNFNKFFN